jgi:uncharacterized membrane protein YvlD (DUF360 family)
MKLIFGWMALTVVVLVTVAVLPGLRVDWSVGVYCAVAAGFAVVNVVMGWILTGASVPLKVSTWGPILLVVNTLALLLTDRVMGSLEVDGLWPALLAAAVISLADLVIEGISRSFRGAIARSP